MKRFIYIFLICSLFSFTNIFAEGVPEPATTEAETTEPAVAEVNAPQENLSPAFKLEQFDGTVTKVESADIIFIDGKKFKLIGIDAPKRWWWLKPRYCFSDGAAAYMEDAVLDKPVQYSYLEFHGPRDGKGLKEIYLFKDGRLLNAELVQKGYALAYQKRKYPELDSFREYQAGAKFYQLGLWHHCAVECDKNEICQVKDW